MKIGLQISLLLLLNGNILFSQSSLNSQDIKHISKSTYPVFQRENILVNEYPIFNRPIDSVIIAFKMSCTLYHNGVRMCSNDYFTLIDNNVRIISFTLSSAEVSIRNPNITVNMNLVYLKTKFPELFANLRTEYYNNKLCKVASFYDSSENELRLYLRKNKLELIRYFESEDL